MKQYRVLTAALCAAFLLCGMAAPAYAYSDEPTGGYTEADPAPTDEDVTVEEAPVEGATPEPGQGFSEEGQFVTRDLLYDENTNKQFITVQTKGGSTFYLVIDYDKPVDEEGEQYETYFLSQVDESDLLAALEASGGELPACTCTEKCAAGAVNTDCPVCATNMTECAGVEPEPEPAEPEEPEEAQEPEAGFPAGTLLLALAVVVIGGGAGWYFKIYRPKQERAEAQAQEDYPDEADPYDDPDGDYDPYGGEDDPEDEETEGRP